MEVTKGERLKKFRENIPLSQQEMSLKLQCSQAHLSAMENGTRQVSANIVNTLADNFSILNMDWFVHGRGEMLYKSQGEKRQGTPDYVKVATELYQIDIVGEKELTYNSPKEDILLEYMGVYGEIKLYTVKETGKIYKKGTILVLKPLKTSDLIGNRVYLIETDKDKQILGDIENFKDYVQIDTLIIQKDSIKAAYQIVKVILDV